MLICKVHIALLYPSICLIRKGLCVHFPTSDALFLVDTLPALGYTLAGFHDVSASIAHRRSKPARMCLHEARQAAYRLTLSLILKEVHEWQNQ